MGHFIFFTSTFQCVLILIEKKFVKPSYIVHFSSLSSHCETDRPLPHHSFQMSDFSGWIPQGLKVGAVRAQVRTGLLTRRLKMTLETRFPQNE